MSLYSEHSSRFHDLHLSQQLTSSGDEEEREAEFVEE